MSSVVFFGPEGTFSGILARKRFGKRAELVSCPTIESVFEKVGTGLFANTLAGVTRFARYWPVAAALAIAAMAAAGSRCADRSRDSRSIWSLAVSR
jgi:hypothetical protein